MCCAQKRNHDSGVRPRFVAASLASSWLLPYTLELADGARAATHAPTTQPTKAPAQGATAVLDDSMFAPRYR